MIFGYIVYIIILMLFSLYSYSLVDLNFTLVNQPWWTAFRNQIIYLGYFQRYWSWLIYLFFILFLFISSSFFVKNYKKINIVQLMFIITGVVVFSYPFLSHDFFNYLFDAKIITLYGQNPYLYKALDFPSDPWLRFMHWTHRTYPYGPIFLLITLIPSFLSFGKFFLSFFLFKTTWVIFYLFSVYFLNKLNKKWAVIFATHPLIIVEGLVNVHNDLIGVALAIAGIYFLVKNKNILGRLFLILSAGIKYITFPLIFLTKKTKNINNIILMCLIIILSYLTFFAEIQPWYFLVFFALLPYYDKLISRLNIFFAGLLLSYYPYIRLGGWDSLEKIQLKHIIILAFTIFNFVYLGFVTRHEKIF